MSLLCHMNYRGHGVQAQGYGPVSLGCFSAEDTHVNKLTVDKSRMLELILIIVTKGTGRRMKTSEQNTPEPRDVPELSRLQLKFPGRRYLPV